MRIGQGNHEDREHASVAKTMQIKNINNITDWTRKLIMFDLKKNAYELAIISIIGID